jgi:D-beta-D-heptose 7-phosphate kinase/D-beta-D-heptose 1-phosphate adenosyltransferase
VVLSDYAKGALTPRVIRAVIDAANERGKPVLVDPKGRDYSIYRGATLITPNRQELADATHSPARTDEEIAAAAVELRDSAGAKAVLVTRSEAGMTLVSDGAAVHVPAYAVRVRDVSGAGDTVVAVLSAMLAMKADFESAVRAANAAAAIVVGKRGTATASVAELRARILPAATLAPQEKIIFDWAVLDDHLAEWRKQGASWARQAVGGRAGGLRSTGCRPQWRCIGYATERRRPSCAGGTGARGSVGGA